LVTIANLLTEIHLGLIWSLVVWILIGYTIVAGLIFLVTLVVTVTLFEGTLIGVYVSGMISLTWPALLGFWLMSQGWFDWLNHPPRRRMTSTAPTLTGTKPSGIQRGIQPLPTNHSQPPTETD
jgi:hypothetical protein